jgi:glycosyltransferase involved in cell wall biosynthesis
MITDGIEGYLWDTNDPETSAQALIHILDNREVLDAMSAAARRKYLACFQVDLVAPRLYEFLSGSLPPSDRPKQPTGETDMTAERPASVQ